MYEKDQPTTLLLAQCMGRRVWMRVFVFHFHASQTHFHKKSLARGLVLKQRQKATRKWPIQRISTPANLPRQQLELRCYHNRKL